MLICQPPPVRVLSRHSCDGYYLMWYYNGWHYWYFLPGRISVVTEGEEYRRLSTMVLSMSSGQIDRDQAKAIKTILLTKEIYILSDYWWKHLRIEPGSVVFYDNSINGAEIEFNAVIGNRLLSMTGFSPTSYPYVPSGIIIPPITPIKYGALYNWYAATDPRYICSLGWHIPTKVEFETLQTYLGGVATAGDKLKEAGIVYWDAINGGTNETGFNARGSDMRDFDGVFLSLNNTCHIWSSTIVDSDWSYTLALEHDQSWAVIIDLDNNCGFAIRPIKDSTILTHGQTGTYTDPSGITYRSICIGTQEFVADNIITKHYRNSDPIPEIQDDATWAGLLTGAWCYNNNDPANM